MSSTALTLIVLPVYYELFDDLATWVKRMWFLSSPGRIRDRSPLLLWETSGNACGCLLLLAQAAASIPEVAGKACRSGHSSLHRREARDRARSRDPDRNTRSTTQAGCATARNSIRLSIATNRSQFVQGRRQVIAGWEAGFEGMKVGGKRRLHDSLPIRVRRKRPRSDPAQGGTDLRCRTARRTDVPEHSPAADLLLSVKRSRIESDVSWRKPCRKKSTRGGRRRASGRSAK